MMIHATETRQVKVDVTPEECFQALCSHVHLRHILYPSNDTIWKEERNKNGVLTQLVEETDISRHGSPCWQPTGKVVADSYTLNLYQHFLAVKQLLDI